MVRSAGTKAKGRGLLQPRPLQPTHCFDQQVTVPTDSIPPLRASNNPSLNQLYQRLADLREESAAYEARALTSGWSRCERRAWLERAIVDAGGEVPDGAGARFKFDRSRARERARKARRKQPERAAYAVVLAALREIKGTGRGATTLEHVRDWVIEFMGDADRLAAHRDRKCSPAELCRMAGVEGNGGRAEVTAQAARAGVRQLAAALPGIFEGGFFLRRYLRFAKSQVLDRKSTPATVAAAWASSRVEFAKARDGAFAAGRSDRGAREESSEDRTAGASISLLTSGGACSTRTPPCSEIQLEPGQPRADKLSPVAPGRKARPEGRKGGSPPSASAALAGETAGRAPASSAGAGEAQPPGGSALRATTVSAWISKYPSVAELLGVGGRLLSILEPSPRAGTYGESSPAMALVIGHGGPRALAEQLLAQRERQLAQLGGAASLVAPTRASTAGTLRRMLQAGDLVRGAGGMVFVPAFVRNEALDVLGVATPPGGSLPTAKRKAQLHRDGVDNWGLSGREAKVLADVLHARRKLGLLSFKQLSAVAAAGGYPLCDLSGWVVHRATQEDFAAVMRAARQGAEPDAGPGVVADVVPSIVELPSAAALEGPVARIYRLRPSPDGPVLEMRAAWNAGCAEMGRVLDRAHLAGFATIREQMDATAVGAAVGAAPTACKHAADDCCMQAYPFDMVRDIGAACGLGTGVETGCSAPAWGDSTSEYTNGIFSVCGLREPCGCRLCVAERWALWRPEAADLTDEQPGPDAADLDEAAALWDDADAVILDPEHGEAPAFLDDPTRAGAPAVNDHEAQLAEPPLERVAARVDVDALLERRAPRLTRGMQW